MLPEDSGFNPQAMYGQPAEVVLQGWVTLAEYVLGRVDETRSLMRELLE
jgi:hypothetical protein